MPKSEKKFILKSLSEVNPQANQSRVHPLVEQPTDAGTKEQKYEDKSLTNIIDSDRMNQQMNDTSGKVRLIISLVNN